MSEKRRKRTRKANNQSMRNLQTRPGESNLQAETESMPQQEGQVVAETDRTNTEIGGYKDKMRDSFMDKIREHKTTIIQIVVVAAIAVIVCAIMTPQLAPSKAGYNAAITGLEGDIARAGASINTLGTALDNRMDTLEGDIDTIDETTEVNSQDIGTLLTWKDATGLRITTLESQNSPLEGYLTGAIGNYTLHAKCSVAGNFTANVHLIYSPAVVVGNTTHDDAMATFYGSINWTAANTTVYMPTLTYNSTAWFVSQVWFNIGTFAMMVNNETSIDIIFSGLNSTYAPNFVYAEVWPVLK